VVGLTILGILVLLAIFGPLICKFDYTDPDFTAINVAPNARHWFGTDGGGFDLFACVVHGLGRSLVIGLTYAILTTAISAIVGTAIAYARGWGEKIGMWLLDMLLVIPSFLLVAMIVRAASGTQGWLMLILGLTAFGWIGYARTLRTMALSLRERDYVRAAKYMGVPSIKIIVRHLIPNLGSILVIDTVLGVISGINSETAYSFLGLGIKAPDTSLGYILSQGSSAMLSAPWIVLIPSVVLIILCVSMQLIGDGLRDAFDPYSRAAGEVADEESKKDEAEKTAAAACWHRCRVRPRVDGDVRMSDTTSTTTMDDTLRYELLEANGPKGAPTGDPVMSVRNLRVSFNTEAGVVHAVRDVNFDLWGGRTLGIVGESGSGKSVTALSLIGLLDDNAHVSGSVKLNGEELIGKSDEEMSKIRGARISMIFQDPLSALTPMFSIGDQLAEALLIHNPDMTKDRGAQALHRAAHPGGHHRSGEPPGRLSARVLRRHAPARGDCHRHREQP
jgi:peptide/nickel transport system permease protein